MQQRKTRLNPHRPSDVSAADMLMFQLEGSPKTLHQNPKPNKKVYDLCWAAPFCFSIANMSTWLCLAGWCRRFKERHICEVPKYLPSTTLTTLPLLPAYVKGHILSPLYPQRDTSGELCAFPPHMPAVHTAFSNNLASYIFLALPAT